MFIIVPCLHSKIINVLFFEKEIEGNSSYGYIAEVLYGFEEIRNKTHLGLHHFYV